MATAPALTRTCRTRVACSQGRQHRQLVKSGNDDLRQDAVMQQFFRLINSVLAQCPATHKRRLSMATYKARVAPVHLPVSGPTLARLDGAQAVLDNGMFPTWFTKAQIARFEPNLQDILWFACC